MLKPFFDLSWVYTNAAFFILTAIPIMFFLGKRKGVWVALIPLISQIYSWGAFILYQFKNWDWVVKGNNGNFVFEVVIFIFLLLSICQLILANIRRNIS